MNHIITLDGPAASGKGTLAKRLAGHLDYFYLDTGKIYRLVGLEVLKAGINNPADQVDRTAEVTLAIARLFSLDMLDNPDLKSDLAGKMASLVGSVAKMRQAIIDLQRELAQNPPTKQKGAVLDGRDCGTVICPDALYKFFISADTEVRAERRYQELLSRGTETSYETVLQDMRERDERDANRDAAPMKPAEEAIIIDTSKMSPDDAFLTVLNAVQN